MRIAIAGSHGLLGSALARRALAEGYEVLRLVRGRPGAGQARWEPGVVLDPAVLEGTAAVVNLAGAGIGDRRWNGSYKRVIRDSRVFGTKTLAAAVAGCPDPKPVLVNGSAVGFYGNDRGTTELTEASPAGTDFLARVCREWEDATAAAADAGARVVTLRSGLVLAAAGGVLARQLPLFRIGLGARLGSGDQFQSWITRQDHVAAMLHVIRTPELSGPVNLTAPQPVTNREMTEALAAVLRRPARLRVPAALLRVALGPEMAEETLLAGQRVLPARLAGSGFVFAHPDLPGALEAALQDRQR